MYRQCQNVFGKTFRVGQLKLTIELFKYRLLVKAARVMDTRADALFFEVSRKSFPVHTELLGINNHAVLLPGVLEIKGNGLGSDARDLIKPFVQNVSQHADVAPLFP